MNTFKQLVLAMVITGISFAAAARDTVHQYPVQALLETTKAQEALHDLPLFFGSQEHPEVAKTYGEVMSNRKTNAFLKSDREACEWVMLGALKSLQERAQKEGMDAVVGIESYYNKREFVSETEYECGAGAIMAGVTLKGTLVKFAD